MYGMQYNIYKTAFFQSHFIFNITNVFVFYSTISCLSFLAVILDTGCLMANSPGAIFIGTVARCAFIDLHLSSCWDNGNSCKTVGSIFADRAALIWFVYWIHTFNLSTLCYGTVHFPIGFTATFLAGGNPEFLQLFIFLFPKFTVILYFLALRATSAGVHTNTTWM